MDEREALERLAAADHAACVLERAQAGVVAADSKVGKAQAQLDAADDAVLESRTKLAEAEEAHEARVAAADEVPMDLRAWVMTHRPDVMAAHVGPAVASGGAS